MKVIFSRIKNKRSKKKKKKKKKKKNIFSDLALNYIHFILHHKINSLS